MAHVAEYKKRIVKRIVDLINAYPIVGMVNVENLPAPQLQKMRAHLRGNVDIFMTKKRIMRIAFDDAKASKPGVEKLKEYFKGMPALIFAKDNPFALAKTLRKNKSTAPAKPGQTAPKDIVVQAGPTSFSPGPIIGELSAVGIKTQIDKGKIAIKEDCVVCKEGEKISVALASILTRLGIEPMEVGLDLVATYENELIYTKDVLDIDEEEFMNNLSQAGAEAFNLAVEISYPTKDTIELLLSNAFMDAKALALEANIMADAVAEELLGKAEQQMLSLKSTANIEISEKKAEAKPETPVQPPEEKKPAEPKKEEPKPEPPKPEEKPAEEKKEPEPPKEEPKKEVPKPEAPKEEPKQETPKVEEPQPEEKPSPKEEKKPEEPKKEEPKPEVIEKKEEKVLEEEKKIIQEEKKLEEQKPAPTKVEEEVQEAVKEEEEKQLEKERIEKEKKLEEVDKQVAKLVEQTKKMAKKEETLTAEKIVQEAKEEVPEKEEPVKEGVKQESQSQIPKKPEPKKAEKVDTEVAKLVEQTKRQATKEATAEKMVEEVKEESREEDDLKKKQEAEKKKQQDVEDLAKQLMRKGTLRK